MAEASGSARIGKSVAALLAASDDPATIAALLPGCEKLHRIDAEHIEGRLATEVSGVPIQAAVSIRRTVESLPDGLMRLHLRLKIRPDIGGQAIVASPGGAMVPDLLRLRASHLELPDVRYRIMARIAQPPPSCHTAPCSNSPLTPTKAPLP